MQKKWAQFHAELVQQQQAAVAKAEALRAENRGDESVFERIRANVYGIFASVLEAADKQYGADETAMRQFCLRKLEEIPAEWEAAAQKADVHHDEHAAFIERLKLRAAGEIRQKALAVSEERSE
ncbi:MAG TPA: hypothetical protein H9915_06630 [Candidatus Gemmiger faecigallinarum]|nr:hypothetical protein [Candidatus Gemmiger faecigallinarum]